MRKIYMLTLQQTVIVVTCPALNLANGQISYDVSPVNGRYPVGTTIV